MKISINKYIFVDRDFTIGKSILSKISLFVLVFLFLSSIGCVAFKGTSSKWEESYSDISVTGPGSSDLLFRKWEYNKFKYDDGSRIAIGLFPGASERFIDGEFASGDFEGDTWGEYFFWTIALQSAFAIPTISSLLIEPFGDTEYSGHGLVGCHRWSVAPSRKFIKQGASEVQVVRHGFSQSLVGHFVIGWSKDRTRLYFEYPGCETIFEEVAENGKVDVMFPNSYYVRRFSKSKEKKFKGVALVYEDYDARLYPSIMEQISHQREFKRIKKALLELESSTDYSYADESIKLDMKLLKEEVYNQLATSLPTNENALSRAEKKVAIIKDGLGAIVIREEQARKEAEATKFRNVQLKRVLALQKTQKWNDIVDICDEMLWDEKTKHDKIWTVYKQNAEREIEKQNAKKIEEQTQNKRNAKMRGEIDKLANQVDR